MNVPVEKKTVYLVPELGLILCCLMTAIAFPVFGFSCFVLGMKLGMTGKVFTANSVTYLVYVFGLCIPIGMTFYTTVYLASRYKVET